MKNADACKLCTKEVKDMKRHLARHNLIQNSYSQCNLCTKKFKHQKDMKKHIIQNHANNQVFKCEFEGCRKTFSHENKMKQHSRFHNSKRKTFQCPLCEKVFKMQHSLSHHKLFHTGERPYKCTICSFDCKDPGVLKRHNIHKGKVHKKREKKLIKISFALTRTYVQKRIIFSTAPAVLL